MERHLELRQFLQVIEKTASGMQRLKALALDRGGASQWQI
jgi:hypothetical protein